MAFEELREDYEGPPLLEKDCAADPREQFLHWFDEAVAAEIPMANAMSLATVDAEGQPHVRIVLLKEVDEAGFVFFTNYQSRKGNELAAHPRAALLFWWHPLTRQIRIEGRVEKVSAEASDAYFATRPRGSNLAAIASAQSRPLANRAELLTSMAEAAAEAGDAPLVRPAHWGGYRVVPESYEFWQGQPDRSHDRIEYRPAGAGSWEITRLSP